KREQKHLQIDRDCRSIFADPRDAPGIDRQQEPDPRESKKESKQSAGERYKQTLGKQLANDVPASSAKRRARCEFPLTSGGANQQQIGNVGKIGRASCRERVSV